MLKHIFWISVCCQLMGQILCDDSSENFSMKSILRNVPHLNHHYPEKRVSFEDDTVLSPVYRIEHPLLVDDTEEDEDSDDAEVREFIRSSSSNTSPSPLANQPDFETQYDENNQVISSALMNDYDPEMRRWQYGNYTFHFYIDAFTHVHEVKRKAMIKDRNCMIQTKLKLTPLRSYLNPNGGVLLEIPYRHGVRFSDEEGKWEAYLSLPSPLREELKMDDIVIGHFSNSRNAAVAYNLVLWHLQMDTEEHIQDLFSIYRANRLTQREKRFIKFEEVKWQVHYCILHMHELFVNNSLPR